MSQARAVSVLYPVTDARDKSQLMDYLEIFNAMDVVSTIWLRDLPAVRRGNPDQGPGIDPFVLAASAMSRTTELRKIGVAVAPAGVRHYAALARAATSICDIASVPFRLGIGAGEPSAPWSLTTTGAQSKKIALLEYIQNLCDLLEGVPSLDLEMSRSFSADYHPRVWVATSDIQTVENLAPRIEGWMTWQSHSGFIREAVQNLRSLKQRPRIALTANVCFTPNEGRPHRITTPVPSLRAAPIDIAAYINAHFSLGVDEVIINPCAPASADGSQLAFLYECLSYIDANY